jgi:hypothetical protein
MANKVLTIFEGDAKALFATADQVETRLKALGQQSIATPPVSPAVAAQSPIIQQQKAVTTAVETEVDKQVQAHTNGARKISGVYVQTAEEAQASDERMAKFRDEIRQRREQKEAESATRLADGVKARQIREDQAAIGAFRVRNQAFNIVRREQLAAAEVTEKGETDIVVREAEKRAAARRASILGEGTFIGGAARGAGLAGIGITGAAIGGFAIAAGGAAVISATQSYLKNLEEAEGRTARLRVVSNELSISQKDLASSIESVSDGLRITRQEAEGIVVPLAELANASRKPIAELQSAIVDIASARGIDKNALPAVLKNIAEGSADAAVFGRNAASVFDIYAASIGTTADKLDLMQKQQALTNEVIRQGGLDAGSATNALSNQGAQTDRLAKSWENLKNAIGEAFSPAVRAGINSLTSTLGGKPETVPFDWLRDGAANVKDFSKDIEDAAAETKKKMDAFIKSFQDDRKLVQDAINNPNASIANFGLSKIDLSSFLKQTPEQRQQIKQDAIANAKEIVNAQVQAFQTAFSINAGNIPELQRLLRNLNIEKNFIDPDKFKELTDQADKAIQNGFKNMVDTVKENVPKLRQLYQQVLQSDVPLDEKGSILKSITEQIKRDIDDGTRRVKELADGYRAALQGVFTRGSAQNPFIQFFQRRG